MTEPKQRPDWTKIRLAYVHSTKTMGEVALEFDVTRAAVMKRGQTEGWTAERQRASESISSAANSRYESERAGELAKWNANDLKLAIALRAQIALTINAQQKNSTPMAPRELRSLASAAESIQRVGRLALGASTDNHGLAGQGGEGPVAVTNVPIDDYKDALSKILGMM